MEKNESFKVKIYFIFMCICLGFSSVLLRVGYLQVVKKDELLEYGNKQFIRTTKVYPNRGKILDRNGNALAINVNRFNVFGMAQEMENKKSTSKKVSKIIKEVKYKDLYKSIKDRNKFTWIKRNIDLTKDQVKKLKAIDGVHIEPFVGRYYPNQKLAAQVLGFVDVDNSGISGVEKQFNKILIGKEKTISYVRDAKGRAIKFENLTQSREPKDIELSIDKDIQDIVESAIKAAFKKHKAKLTGAAVMNANTGEILAMANYPSFNPNKPSDSKSKNWKLSYISDPFEPGSVIKPFTVISGLSNNLIEPNSQFYCENGKMKIGKYTIKESAGHKFKWLSVNRIISKSSNIGTSKIAFETGSKNLVNTFRNYGLGERTNVELPYESRGIFKNDDELKKIRLSNLSFGHGIAVSGLQILNMYAPLANGGYKLRPTILKTVGETEKIPVISEKVRNQINDMLVETVEEGTGDNAQIEGYKIAGKTGTAQKPNDKEGGYLEDEFISSFVGYPLEVKSPFIVYVYVDAPSEEGHYGSEVAAPIFKKIARAILVKNNEYHSLAKNVDNKKTEDSISLIASSVKRYKKNKVPNFVGLDRKSVLKLGEKLNIRLKINGFGIVTSQKPKAFSKITGDKTVKLVLKKPSYD